MTQIGGGAGGRSRATMHFQDFTARQDTTVKPGRVPGSHLAHRQYRTVSTSSSDELDNILQICRMMSRKMRFYVSAMRVEKCFSLFDKFYLGFQ